ncbi:hypothetical protein BV22DRAFT_1065719 [Leucogyrophana mollusca]|uniref:Uncharacterized protein n=1 Tax=Leucogyrophana mollusca TaxID=85980 RepID=A0ACB8BGK1_9AGAM|nr:hypothetical protein BV22DRAFT_1065719 [Leucogyrophana mollusca]
MLEEGASGRKAAFKIYAAKESLAISRNKVEACQYCGATRPPGAKPFPVCSGCHSVRFCVSYAPSKNMCDVPANNCREHQVALWPQHKFVCREQQRNLQNIQRDRDLPLPPGFPPVQECKCILEDWVEVHRQGLEQSLASAIHDLGRPYDLNKDYAIFSISYRPSSGGNPSLAFTVNDADIVPHPPLGTSLGDMLASTNPRVVQANAKEFKHPEFLAAVPCVYSVDKVFLWISYLYLKKMDIPTVTFKDRPWFWWLNFCCDAGLVFRKGGPHHAVWHPGLMEKEGNKWVWKEKTLSELAAKGTHLLRYPRHMHCPYIVASMRQLYE